MRLSTVLPIILLASGIRAVASDWPQFLGPQRNGNAAETSLATNWPASGPRLIWKTPVGEGFSGPVVASNRVVLFHRLRDEEVLSAWSVANGSNLWRHSLPAKYQDPYGRGDGPRATPAIAQGKVVSFGPDGRVACLNFENGKPLWSRDGAKEFGARPGFFGLASSPLILDRSVVVLHVGGRPGASVIALDLATGKELWRSGEEEAGYASPVVGTFGGNRQILVFTREGLKSLVPESGKQLWTFPWRSRSHASVNAATPLVIGDLVFLSASYETGAILLRVKSDGPEKVWSGDEQLSNHFVTSVHRDGFLYGLDGRHEESPRLRCVDLKTGQPRWTVEEFGSASFILSGGLLLVLKENGELVLARATPEAFKPLATAQVLGLQTRATPALAGGFLFARDQSQLICLDLRAAPNR